MLKESPRRFNSLAYPISISPLELLIDASDVAVGAELQQLQPDGSLKPLAFISKKSRPSEKRYSVFDEDLYLSIFDKDKYLSVYLSTSHFRY